MSAFRPTGPRRLVCLQPRGLNGPRATSTGKDGRASRPVPRQPFPAQALHSVAMRENDVVRPVACGCAIPAAAVARAASMTAAYATARGECAHSRRSHPSATSGQKVTSTDDRTTRQPPKRGELGTGAVGQNAHVPAPSRIAAHASAGMNRPCIEVSAQMTDPTARTAGTSCVALFGIKLCKRLLNRHQHCIASLRQFGHGSSFVGFRQPLLEQLRVRLVQFR